MSGTSGTTKLSLQTFTTLVQNAAAVVQGAASQLIDLASGSVLRVILEASASVGLWLQYLVFLVLQTTRLATSSGGDCDSFGADFGFTRLPAVAAAGSVTFSRFSPSQAAFIPVGTNVMTSDQTQTFSVIADTTNAAYTASPVAGYTIPANVPSLTVTVQAAIPGGGGNVLASAIGLISSAIPGVDTVTNAAGFTNGIDAETDAAFKTRFANYINTRSLATYAAVGYAVSAVQQGLTYTIQPNTNTAGAYAPGTFVVTIDDGTGNPPASLLSTVSDAIANVAPLGSTWYVAAPVEILANVSLLLTVNSSVIKANVTGPVGQAVTAYINSLPVGTALPYSRIAQIAYDANTAITNVTSVLLNNGTADLGGGVSQVIRAGSVAVS